MRLIDCRPKPQSLVRISRSGSMCLSALADQFGDLLRPLHLQRAVADDAERDLLVLGDHGAEVLEIHAAVERAFDREHVAVELIEIGQRRLVGLIFAGDALRCRRAPAGVAPDLAFAAQALHLDVESFHPLLGLDRLLGIADDLMDGRLLDLHHRRAGIGQRVIFLVERGGEIHQQIKPVLVVLVSEHQRQYLRRDRADLHRPVGHRRDRLVGAVELQIRRADFGRHRRRHAGLDHLPHQIARPFVGHEAGRRHFDAWAADAGDAFGDVAHPGAAGDVVVEPGVAVHHDVDAGAVLRRHVAGETIEMLFAVGEAGEALRERNAAQIFGVPARPRQCAGGGGEQRLVLGGGEHPNSPCFVPPTRRPN